MNRTAHSAAPPRTKGLMFDLDGTLLLSDRFLGGYEVLPGAAELLTELERRAVPFVVLTNGSAYPEAACHAIWGGAPAKPARNRCEGSPYRSGNCSPARAPVHCRADTYRHSCDTIHSLFALCCWYLGDTARV